jgi:hypothetical protein
MNRIQSILVALAIAQTFNFSAQENSDPKKLAFGFNFGLNYSQLYNGKATDELGLHNNAGFRLGVISSYRLNDKYSLLPKAELSFNNGTVTKDLTRYTIYKSSLDAMVHFKYSFGSRKNKLYLFAGPVFRIPLNDQSADFQTKASLALDCGFGMDFVTKNFKISPELRISGGLMDVRANPTGNQLRFSNFALIINFSSL